MFVITDDVVVVVVVDLMWAGRGAEKISDREFAFVVLHTSWAAETTTTNC